MRGESDDGGGSLQSFESVELALAFLAPDPTSGSQSCGSGGDSAKEQWSFMAWIDRDGDEICDTDNSTFEEDYLPNEGGPPGVAEFTLSNFGLILAERLDRSSLRRLV